MAVVPLPVASIGNLSVSTQEPDLIFDYSSSGDTSPQDVEKTSVLSSATVLTEEPGTSNSEVARPGVLKDKLKGYKVEV